MKVLLKIDTTNNKEVRVGLEIDGILHEETVPLNTRKAQIVLPLTEKLLQENQLTPQDITEIEVNPGPGSFTGLRVGISIANTLGYVLQIPVNGMKIGEQVEAMYS